MPLQIAAGPTNGERANPQAKRAEIVDECIRREVAYYTARTQHQRWSKSKTMAIARELAQPNDAVSQAVASPHATAYFKLGRLTGVTRIDQASGNHWFQVMSI